MIYKLNSRTSSFMLSKEDKQIFEDVSYRLGYTTRGLIEISKWSDDRDALEMLMRSDKIPLVDIWKLIN